MESWESWTVFLALLLRRCVTLSESGISRIPARALELVLAQRPGSLR